ncbi:MAG TPA: type II secretion system F family protein [Anaerolineales bacterium]|nr:type II secretion system F family protein [Anaerolineales bacterium]
MSILFSQNVLFALLFAVGVFVLVIGTQWTRPVRLSNVEQLYGEGKPREDFLQGLQARLDAARFNLSVEDFLKVVAVLVVGVFFAAYLLVGAVLPALMAAAMAIFGYWTYLNGKAAKAIEDYEEQLPQVVSRLVVGARMGNSFRGAAEHAAQFGPPLCRDDWAYICRQLDAGADLEMILRVVSGRRQSQLLNSIFELILVQHQRGTPISDVMPLIQESLTQRTRTIRLARTKLRGPLRELYIVCAAPVAAVVLARFLSPQYAALYAEPVGQLIVTGAWAVDAALFLWLQRAFSQDLRRETNFYGDLKPQPRTPLDETRPQGRGSGGARGTEPLTGVAPASLSRLFGPRGMAAPGAGGSGEERRP